MSNKSSRGALDDRGLRGRDPGPGPGRPAIAQQQGQRGQREAGADQVRQRHADVEQLAGQRRADDAGQALGFQQSAGALARIAGPALAGRLFDVRVPLPYLVGAGLTLAALALLLGDRLPAGSGAPAAQAAVVERTP